MTNIDEKLLELFDEFESGIKNIREDTNTELKALTKYMKQSQAQAIQSMSTAVQNEISESSTKISSKATKSLSEAAIIANQATANLTSSVEKLKKFDTWYIPIFTIMLLMIFVMAMVLYEQSLFNRIGELNREIARRERVLIKTPNMIEVTMPDDSKILMIETSADAKPMKLTSGEWVVKFK